SRGGSAAARSPAGPGSAGARSRSSRGARAARGRTPMRRARSETVRAPARPPGRPTRSRELRQRHPHQGDALLRSLAVDFDFLVLVEHLDALDDAAERRVLAVETARVPETDEERGLGGVGLVGARHAEDPLDVARRVELRLEAADQIRLAEVG